MDGGRIVALWGEDDTDRNAGFVVNVALVVRPGMLCARLELPAADPVYPSIADIFPAAGRMQRAVFDLLGIRAQGCSDERKWLRHGAWPAGTGGGF